MLKRFFPLIGIVGLVIACRASENPPVQTKVVLSPIYTIDKIYRSMEGPTSSQKVSLLDSPNSELLWIIGFKTEMMQDDGVTPSKPEFMCHVNLDFNALQHQRALGMNKLVDSRLLTLSQGELSVQFPKGFGMPILSNESLSLSTQVLNLNNPTLKTKVRHKVTFEFVRDRDLKEPMKPLFDVTPFVMVPIDEQKSMPGMDMKSMPTMHGESCLPVNQEAPNAHGGSTYKDETGHTMSGHWVVPPGHSVVRTDVTQLMNIPFDTTLHFAAVHLHPYAKSLELRDVTTKKTVFKSHARNPKNRIGLDAVDNYSSEKGTPIYKNHQYELTSIYDNPTKQNSDSMAVMLLFLLDKEFKKPVSPHVVMHTSLGDLTLVLDNAVPMAVQQFLASVKAGAYDDVPMVYLKPGFLMGWGSPKGAVLQKLPFEFGTWKHTRGVLSMAHATGEADGAAFSFCIMLGPVPDWDNRYTTFGRIETGYNVLTDLEAVSQTTAGKPLTPVDISHMEISAAPKP